MGDHAPDLSLLDDRALLLGQKRVLEMVATGAPLADTLAELTCFIEAQEEGLRCGILIVTDDGEHFRSGCGPNLPETYHRALDGVPITPPYLGPCGQAAHQGTEVLVPDIATDTRWAAAWRDVALSCGVASCRSIPVTASDGRVQASFAMYYDRPRDPTPAHPHLVEIATHLARIALGRALAETRARESEERLAAELAATQRLQEFSTLLIQEGNVDALYQHLLDAATAVMHSDMASLQMLDEERGELRLLAWKGFHPESAAHWRWVRAGTSTSCSAALVLGKRVIVPDAETCDFIIDTPDLDVFRKSGIRAVQSTPLLSRSGRLLGVMSTHWCKPGEPADSDLRLFDVLARQAADLIERAHADAALKGFNASLEARVEERTRELEAANEERRKAEAALLQSQRLEAVGQLTGGVAHDFNNLLTVVVGHAEVITAAAKDSNIAQSAAAIQRAAERGARLTGQLLAFARRQKLRPVTVTFDRLMASIDDLVGRAVGESVEVEFSAAPSIWPTLVDPAQFESAILNLSVNARDAMPGGGRLVVAARNASIVEIEAARLDLTPGDYIVVSVADTGTGMPPDVRERAFEPFFTTKDEGKGTGLGLAQIYGFAKQSGGAVTIESTMGMGTTVSLYLPRATTELIADESLPREEMPENGHGRTVLVVEDQPEVREVVGMFLEDLGYRVLTASDGAAAQKVLASNEAIDLLLTDVVMPKGVSGVDLAQAARRLRQDLKILLVSGFPRDFEGRSVSIPDEFMFLEKPFRQEELAAAIASAFSERQRQPSSAQPQ